MTQVMPSPVELLAAIGSGLIALVFVRAALHKLFGFGHFSASLAGYRLLPPSSSEVAAGALLAAECIVIASLSIAQTRVYGAALATFLLLLYALAMAINLQRGRPRIDCGCGGDGQGISWLLVSRNGVLATMAACIASSGDRQALAAGALPAVIACVVLGGLLLLIVDQIAGNRSHAAATSHFGFEEPSK
jgi:hypothetical protein